MNKKKTSPGYLIPLNSLSIAPRQATPSRQDPAGHLSAWRLPAVDGPDHMAELRRIRWAARQVVGHNLDGAALGREALTALLASLERQADGARALQRRLACDGASDDLQEEATELGRFLAAASNEARRQLARPH